MHFSIEVPVYRKTYLKETIESVIGQTSSRWRLYLLWDRKLLGEPPSGYPFRHPGITYLFRPNRGIAASRRLLTRHTESDAILPLDDDDRLLPNTLEAFSRHAAKHRGFGIIRARREFIDTKGKIVDQRCWFPFEQRRQYQGMTIDIHNHAQPYVISRNAYMRTKGWEGFAEFGGAGEDCDIFLKIEEVAPIVLLDSVLYQYRLHNRRYSLTLKEEGAFAMWRKLMLKTLRRRGLNIMLAEYLLPYFTM